MNGKQFDEIFVMWLGRANANIRTVEEEPNYEKNCHPSRSSDEPQRKCSFSPTGLPGNCWSAVRKTIRNTTVREIGFLTAHDSGLQLKK
jgi:hypothetical protein